jgi:small-conductance mechanosensitive channel
VVRSIPAAVGALRAIEAKAKPDRKRALPAVLTAWSSIGVGERLGAARRRSLARFGNAVQISGSNLTIVVLGLGVLALLHVNLANLLVGGAVTGVVLGIAAQQTLGNFFAGLVLLFAHPWVPGQQVKIRSDALGTFEGTITGSSLMYTTIDTSEGLISLPNSGLLAAAIGPAPRPTATDQDLPAIAAIDSADRGRATSRGLDPRARVG